MDNTERQSIVAWLRDRSRVHRSNAENWERLGYPDEAGIRHRLADYDEATADQIERGDHFKEQAND
jgi:hypothetical protein